MRLYCPMDTGVQSMDNEIITEINDRIPSQDELEITITVDWLADWLERVSNRLVFFSYKGGCGGEYIVNTIQESFYSTLRVHDDKCGSINPINNRSQSIDHLFNDFFISYNHEDESIENFSDLARELLEYYSGTSLLCLQNIYHFGIIGEYAIVRMHYIPKWMALFEDSIKISLIPGTYQWDMYCRIASFLKVDMLPIYTREDKIYCINEEFDRIKNNEIAEWLNLIPENTDIKNDDAINLVIESLSVHGKLDDDVMLFSGTITALLCEQYYDKNKINYSIDEINKKNNANNEYLKHNEFAYENLSLIHISEPTRPY